MTGAYSVRAAAREFFNPPIDPRVLYRAIKLGQLTPHNVVGRRNFLLARDLEQFVEERAA
jgi:hypothetical protein